MNRSQALRELELLENYEFDRGDAPVRLLVHLGSQDLEVVLSALRTATVYMGAPGVWERVFEMAQSASLEEVRGAANAALWPVMQEGGFWDWKPEEADEDTEVIEPLVPREIYEPTKGHLLTKVEQVAEPVEVRRRCLESLGHIAFLPEVKQIVLRLYRESENMWMKVSAVYAMGLQQEDEFESIVLEELHASHPALLAEAVHAAASLALEESWPLVQELLDHEDKDVRYEAVAAVGWLAPMEAVEEILSDISRRRRDARSREAVDLARQSLEERRREEAGENPDDGWRMDQVWDEIDRMTDGTVRDDDEEEDGGPRPGRAKR
ncbi:MAG: HEAT repeat domain-containing protein [Fibrobacteria bacterium]|nr:HEAT repeat domain-containing protein [Fibrobacteria bacterium]